MATIEGESVEDDSPAKNPEDSGQISCFTPCTSTKNRPILGLQPRDKAAMLVVNTKEIFLLNLHQNRVHFPAERNAFVLDHQHGRRDVTCKPAIRSLKNRFSERAFLFRVYSLLLLLK